MQQEQRKEDAVKNISILSEGRRTSWRMVTIFCVAACAAVCGATYDPVCASGTGTMICMVKGDIIEADYGDQGLFCPEDMETIDFDCTGKAPVAADSGQKGDIYYGSPTGLPNMGTKHVVKMELGEDGCTTWYDQHDPYTCYCWDAFTDPDPIPCTGDGYP